MPFLFTHVEYCDMHYVYGYCDGNTSAAVNEYRRRYPERRIPSKRVFTRVEQSLHDNGCLLSFVLHSEREIVRTINARENIRYRKMWGAYVLRDYMKVSQTSKCFIQTIAIVQFKAKPTMSVCYET